MLVTMDTAEALVHLKLGNLRGACDRYERGDLKAAKSIRFLCLRFQREGLAHLIPANLNYTLVKAWNED